MWASSNPVLSDRSDAFDRPYGAGMRMQTGAADRPNVTTMSGVINKTAILSAITLICGGIGYGLFRNHPEVYWVSAVVGLVISLGIGFALCGRPSWSPVIAPVYAVSEGVFLGAFTAVADSILASRGLALAGGVGAQALVVTAGCLVSILILYRLGVVRPTARFRAALGVASLGIGFAYLASFVLTLFGHHMPIISFYSAMNDHGPIALVGLGVNAFILVIASLSLVVDFGTVEEKVESGAPKYMEWYCGFAILVTLAWIYYESVKMLVRVASILGSRK